MKRILRRPVLLGAVLLIVIGILPLAADMYVSHQRDVNFQASLAATAVTRSNIAACVSTTLSAEGKSYLAKSALQVGEDPRSPNLNLNTPSSVLEPLWRECGNRLAIPDYYQQNASAGIFDVYRALSNDPEYQTEHLKWQSIRSQELAGYSRRAEESEMRAREGRSWLYREGGQN